MDNKRTRLLVVDDEPALCESLATYLDLEGYEVATASSAEQALELDIPSFHLILLDIMMDGISGIELAGRLKASAATADVPIIFLTARDSDDDMVAGLRLGADDYIAKPYSVRNVLARIESVLRRVRPRSGVSHGVVVDRRALSVTIDSQPLKLPRKEFEILALLVENPGRVFSREELIRHVWPDKIVITDRSIDVHITRIRGKIAPYGKNIITRSGYGYGWQNIIS